MLLSICGTPSPLSFAMARLVTLIAEATIGAPIQINVNGTAQLRDVWKDIPKEKRNSILVFSDAPEAGMTDLFSSSDIPVIIINDSLENIISHRLAFVEHNFTYALQQASLSIVQVCQLKEKVRNIQFDGNLYSRRIVDLIREIVEFYAIPLNDDQLNALVQEQCGADQSRTFSEFVFENFPEWSTKPGYLSSSLSRTEKAALQEVASGYDALSAGHTNLQMTWPACCFFDGDIAGRPADGSKLLVGPARHIFYGPYLRLPAGHWNCEVHIELNDCRADTIAMLDVFNEDAALSAVSMRLPRRGVFSIDISFDLVASQKGIELRLALLKGALEGELLLLGAKLSLEGGISAKSGLYLSNSG